MAQQISARGALLTPEEARNGYRWLRIYALATIVQIWVLVPLLALLVPGSFSVVLAAAILYSLIVPLLLRRLRRAIGPTTQPQRRSSTSRASDSR